MIKKLGKEKYKEKGRNLSLPIGVLVVESSSEVFSSGHSYFFYCIPWKVVFLLIEDMLFQSDEAPPKIYPL